MTDFFAQYATKLADWWNAMSGLDIVWFGVGLAGQMLFTFRWIIQWLASEKAGRIVVPELFWYTSLVGGLMVMAYGLYKPDPIIVLGQFGVFFYARNVYFLMRQGRGDPQRQEEAPSPRAPAE